MSKIKILVPTNSHSEKHSLSTTVQRYNHLVAARRQRINPETEYD